MISRKYKSSLMHRLIKGVFPFPGRWSTRSIVLYVNVILLYSGPDVKNWNISDKWLKLFQAKITMHCQEIHQLYYGNAVPRSFLLEFFHCKMGNIAILLTRNKLRKWKGPGNHYYTGYCYIQWRFLLWNSYSCKYLNKENFQWWS